jgi:RNA polymerase sigma factor (sigma-70 family)
MTAATLPDDNALLHDYAERCSSESFTLLVQRHVDAVFSSALRRANGDRAMAEDIAQQVFTDFARKAPALPEGTVPGGWLHRHTGFVASHFIDRERRRRAREQQAAAMNALALTEHTDATAWEHTAPLLDEALDSLPAPDRDAIVLRFFERRDFRAVGTALGISDDTAQKRVARALEKLRGLLTRRGVTSTGAVLSAILLANSVTPAPAALATALSGRALAGAARSGGTIAALSAAARWKLSAAAAVLVAAGAVPVLIFKDRPQIVQNGATKPAEPAPVAPAPPPVKEVVVAPAPPPAPATPSLDDLIASAARELNGGAQSISATTKGLALLTQIPADKCRDALVLVRSVPDEAARALLYRYILGHWAEKNPWDALNYAEKEIPEQHRMAVSEGVLAAWAARDPKAVFGWNAKTATTDPKAGREFLMAAVFKSLAARGDLDRAMVFLNSIESPNERAQALHGMMEIVQTAEQRERILSAAAAVKDETLRIQMRRAVVENWARQDPASAAAWVEKAQPAWERTRLMDSLGYVWMQRNPRTASAWWIAREPGPDTLVKIINVWSQENPDAAGQWLNSQPAGPQSDAARMTFARQVADLDPESALTWAATVSDETMRESTISHIWKNWSARDSSAAAKFLEQVPWQGRKEKLMAP